jgi:hypothetical protein
MGVSDVYKVARIAEGRSLQRAIAASTLAEIRRSTDRSLTAEKVLKANWPRDEQAMLLLKGAVPPTSTGDFVSRDLVTSFRSLAPGSAAIKLFDSSVKLDLTGINTIRIPYLASLPINPVFVGEGAPAPAVQFTTAATTLGPARKILVLSGVTREMNEALPETAAAVIGTVLADASNASIDKTAFDTNPATAVRPAGLLNGVTPLTASAATDTYMAVSDDLANLAAAIGAAGIDPNDIIYVAGPREATIIKLRAEQFADNVLTTLGLPAKSVAAFAPAAVYSGYQDVPTIETRSEVTIHWEDTTPLPIVSSPGTVAAPARSAFQQELIVIRVKAWCSWAVAKGGVQIVNNVNW